MSLIAGFSGKMYKASATIVQATFDSGAAAAVAGMTWTEVTTVRSVTVSPTATEVDVTTRANNGFAQTAVALLAAGVDMEFLWAHSDTVLVALQTAFYGRSQVCLAFMDGDIATTGSNGLASNWVVTKFERGEPIDWMMMINVTVKPANCTTNYTK